jgi:hypothetical protein
VTMRVMCHRQTSRYVPIMRIRWLSDQKISYLSFLPWSRSHSSPSHWGGCRSRSGASSSVHKANGSPCPYTFHKDAHKSTQQCYSTITRCFPLASWQNLRAMLGAGLLSPDVTAGVSMVAASLGGLRIWLRQHDRRQTTRSCAVSSGVL